MVGMLSKFMPQACGQAGHDSFLLLLLGGPPSFSLSSSSSSTLAGNKVGLSAVASQNEEEEVEAMLLGFGSFGLGAEGTPQKVPPAGGMAAGAAGNATTSYVCRISAWCSCCTAHRGGSAGVIAGRWP